MLSFYRPGEKPPLTFLSSLHSKTASPPSMTIPTSLSSTASTALNSTLPPISSSATVVSPSNSLFDRHRTKERKKKYTLNSYLALSFDAAEESISADASASSNRRKQQLLGSSPSTVSSSGNNKQSPLQLMKSRSRASLFRSHSGESSTPSRRLNNKKEKSKEESGNGRPQSYFYSTSDLPSTHEQHLIHSPYYRALFGNTAALPPTTHPVEASLSASKSFDKGPGETAVSLVTMDTSYSKSRSYSHDEMSCDSPIGTGSGGGGGAEGGYPSTCSESSCTSSSSSDEEQPPQPQQQSQRDRQLLLLRRSSSFSSSLSPNSTTTNSHPQIILKRNNSHSTSNHNLRRALYNSAIKKQLSTDEVSFERRKETTETTKDFEEKKRTMSGDSEDGSSEDTYLSDAMNRSWPNLHQPDLMIDVSSLNSSSSSFDSDSSPVITVNEIPSIKNYDEEYPQLKSPKTASMLLLEEKYPNSPRLTPLSSPTSLSTTTSVTSAPTIFSPPASTSSTIPLFSPSNHLKNRRSPRETPSSAIKKRILGSGSVIDIGEHDDDEDDEEGVTTYPTITTSFSSPFFSPTGSSATSSTNGLSSPFLQDVSSTFSFFSPPPSVIPALALSCSLSSPSFPSYHYGSTVAAPSASLSSSFMKVVSPPSTSTSSPLLSRLISTENDKMIMSRSHSEDSNNVKDDIQQPEIDRKCVLTLKKELKSEEEDATSSPTYRMIQGSQQNQQQKNTNTTMSSSLLQASFSSPSATTSTTVHTTSTPPSATKILIDKVKISRFIYNRLIAVDREELEREEREKKANRRWDDPDTDDDEEEGVEEDEKNKNQQQSNTFLQQFSDLLGEYSSQLHFNSTTLLSKKEKKFFLFQNQYFYPSIISLSSPSTPSSSPSRMLKDRKKKEKKQNSFLLFQEIDFLWFHKLIINYLSDDSSHLSIFQHLLDDDSQKRLKTPPSSPPRSSLKGGEKRKKEVASQADLRMGDGDIEEKREGLNEPYLSGSDRLNENLHRICQVLISSKFYYYCLSQLPFEDLRFQSKLYEFIKILYVKIHENDVRQYYEKEGMEALTTTLEEEEEEGAEDEETKEPFVNRLIDRTKTMSLDESNTTVSTNPPLQSIKKEQSILREIPFSLLEALYLVSHERYQRCSVASQQSYENELDVNFIAQKGLLTVSSVSSGGSSTSSSVASHVGSSLSMHYSLNSIVSSKDERSPYRINDSNYYLLECLRFFLKYEFEYCIYRLYNGIYDLTLVINALSIVKYLSLVIMEELKCYGTRLGNTSELSENNIMLTSLLDIVESILLFYQCILLEVQLIESGMEGEGEGEGGDDEGGDVTRLLKKVKCLLYSTTIGGGCSQNSYNILYFFFSFLLKNWKTLNNSSNNSSTTSDDEDNKVSLNYAQEILFIKLFELLLSYISPENLLFPLSSFHDNNSSAASVSTVAVTSTPVVIHQLSFPKISQDIHQKIFSHISRIFHKLLFSSLTANHHFKVLQTILTFFFSSNCQFLLSYCFNIDFSLCLEQYGLLSDYDDAEGGSGSHAEEKAREERKKNAKKQEAKMFNEQNETRLTQLVTQLRILRNEYWNPTIKTLANQLLDVILYYQMEQFETEDDEFEE
jgi:hypothetical protein